jgi:hypothetical protein
MHDAHITSRLLIGHSCHDVPQDVFDAVRELSAEYFELMHSPGICAGGSETQQRAAYFSKTLQGLVLSLVSKIIRADLPQFLPKLKLVDINVNSKFGLRHYRGDFEIEIRVLVLNVKDLLKDERKRVSHHTLSSEEIILTMTRVEARSEITLFDEVFDAGSAIPMAMPALTARVKEMLT